MTNEYRKNVIYDLYLTSIALFHNINKATAKKVATKYVNAGNVSDDDICINHGKFTPATINMLLKYHVVTQKQVEDKLYRVCHS